MRVALISRIYVADLGYYISNMKQSHVHRLVLAAFLGPRPSGMDVHHIDSNRANNIVTNLVYITRAENNKLSQNNRTMGLPRGVSHSQAKLNDSSVKAIRIMLAAGIHQKDVARIINISQKTVSNIKRGLVWTHVV